MRLLKDGEAQAYPIWVIAVLVILGGIGGILYSLTPECPDKNTARGISVAFILMGVAALFKVI